MPATAARDQDARVGDPSTDRKGLWTGLDQAHAMGVELIAAILVWSGIGHFADRLLGTTPWLLVVGAFIGYGGGLYLVWLRSSRMNARADRERAQRWSDPQEPAGATWAGAPRTSEGPSDTDPAARRQMAGS